MHLDQQLTSVQDQLRAAAALGDEHTLRVADALAAAVAPAVKLAVLATLSAAADEITAALLDYPGSPGVAVRLDGDQVAIEVHSAAPAPEPSEGRRDDGDASARVSLRLSETLKSDIDAAAQRDGVSVNTWLVRAASAALDGPFGQLGAFGQAVGQALGSRGFPDGGRARRGEQHRMTGWING